jgi:hypothetical protein
MMGLFLFVDKFGYGEGSAGVLEGLAAERVVGMSPQLAIRPSGRNPRCWNPSLHRS